jgi:DNA-binding NtrC family response regulator
LAYASLPMNLETLDGSLAYAWHGTRTPHVAAVKCARAPGRARRACGLPKVEEDLMESARILIVDDDKNALDGYKRLLHGIFDIETALGGGKALAAIHLFGPYQVIISDMQMPGMNGAEFLTQVRQLAPDSIRMVLTGYKNIDHAIEAVNEGRIFRYLTKPCEKGELVKTIQAAIEQYDKNAEEKHLVREAREIKSKAASLSKVLLSHELR